MAAPHRGAAPHRLQVRVEGLSGVTYSDSLADGDKVEQQGDVVFDREVDRIYIGSPDSGVKVRCAVPWEPTNREGGPACRTCGSLLTMLACRQDSIVKAVARSVGTGRGLGGS